MSENPWKSALDLLAAIRDAFPGAHPLLSLDREDRSSVTIALNTEPGKVYQYNLDAADIARSAQSVIEELKVIHHARMTA